jgi:ubiquinone/menaquinone biosynthesis C-methylase UbiE
MEAFEKDARDVAAGLYPLSERLQADPVALWKRTRDLLDDAHEVKRRRVEGAGTEARDHPGAAAYPTYYRQNFHFQSGGWFTEDSARRYEAQVEALFAGATGPMRRRALSLLAKAWRERDQRGLAIVDVACGSGAFLVDLKAAFPRARVTGLDLSPAYLAEARARSGAETVQANAEALPFEDGSLDAVTCVFLFHELPPRVRAKVAAELARVLKPGGVLAFADAIQKDRAPELARPLAAFPAFFHEPYFDSYQETDLVALFGAVGLTLKTRDEAFLTQALLFEKA